MGNETRIQFARNHEFVAYQPVTNHSGGDAYNQTHNKPWLTESYTSSSLGAGTWTSNSLQ